MSSKANPGTSRHAAGSNRSETIDPLCCMARCYLQPMRGLQIFGVPGLPEITAGTDLAALIVGASRSADAELHDGDIVVVTSKIVAKAEGRTLELADVQPSPFAVEW